MQSPRSQTGFTALLLLHLIAFAALGAIGAWRLFVAYLGNAVEGGALRSFVFGAAAALSAWGYYALSARNPVRNRRTMGTVALLAWADAALIALAMPTLIYRLRDVPAAAWFAALPTALFALLASWIAWNGVAPAGGAGYAAEDA